MKCPRSGQVGEECKIIMTQLLNLTSYNLKLAGSRRVNLAIMTSNPLLDLSRTNATKVQVRRQTAYAALCRLTSPPIKSSP